MLVEIWSDIACPFCYIGKKNLETALEGFDHKNAIDIVWKSFQLAPELQTMPNSHINDYLITYKGVSQEQAQLMTQQVSNMASAVGLQFNMDKVVVANTRRAHHLLQFAKLFGKQNETKAMLLRAYFTDGQNIDSDEVLTQIAQKMGLDIAQYAKATAQNDLEQAVQQDIYEASQIGVRGVPFFVFDNKYAVTGAQPSELLAEVLQKSHAEWQQNKTAENITIAEGESCTVDGNC
jgi:predicted DsbA family dithiol-disulfide isomerase